MKKTIKKAQIGKGPIKPKKPLTDMQRDEMGNPVTPKQKAASLKGLQKSVEYKGRPKMKSGGSLGMKSVKAGYDKNPGVTRADIIVAAKKQAKKGTKVAKGGAALKKQAAVAIAMKKAGKSPKKMMGGGKCKYGCK